MSIRDNIENVLENIEKSAAKSGRKREDITLVAVTKTVEAQRVMEAYDCGLKLYGENRVQEYRDKREALPADVSWHIIGRLQTNKIKYIIGNVSMIESVDRIELAGAIQAQCEKEAVTADVLLELNTAEEDSKAGFTCGNIEEFAREISSLERLRVRGIMTVAPFTDDEKYLRGIFARTREIYEKIKNKGLPNFDFKFLSMGMSGDYTWAIEEGANMVRVGSAIFGRRNY